MFGYVMPQKSELRIREFEVFKAYYCGLCNAIGKKSQISRLTLTYDMAFLGLLLSSVYNDKEIGIKKLCPYKMKKQMMILDNPYLEYAADLNIILSNRKLIDNYQDDKSIISLIASRFINTNGLSAYTKEKIDKIDYNLKRLNELEKAKCDNLDEVGHYFANLTSDLFNISNDSEGRVLALLGYNMGKWIYTVDAFDDLIKDIEGKKYNPFIYSYGYNGEEPKIFKDSIRESTKFTLVRCLDEMSKAFELLNIKKNKEIIDNIIYLGMMKKTENILGGRCENDKSIRNLRGEGRCNPRGDQSSL